MHMMSRVDNPTNRNEKNKNKDNDSNDISNVSIEHTNKVSKPLRELPEIQIETFDGDESDTRLNSDDDIVGEDISNEDWQIVGQIWSDLQYRGQSVATDLQNDAINTSTRITNTNIRKGSQLDQLNQDEITNILTIARIQSILRIVRIPIRIVWNMMTTFHFE